MSMSVLASLDHTTETDLRSQIKLDQLPTHIAIIMDGNGRWAAKKGLPRIAGHREGLAAIREVLDLCRELGIRIVTIYAFSHENWKRPESEVKLLMNLLTNYLKQERRNFLENDVRLFPIGRLHMLPESVQSLVREVAEETRNCTRQVLIVALSYGGRAEIIDAVQHLIRDVQLGLITDQHINEDLFEGYLSTSGFPDPDLLIRTSGENRLSNFLPWQTAYTELYFTKTFWPDFRRKEILLALLDYQRRERRFGRVLSPASHQSTL